MARAAAKGLGLKEELVLTASTGIIGRPLPIEKIKKGAPGLLRNLSASNGHEFARAIMTTDTVPKEIAIEFSAGGKRVILAGAVKAQG